MSVVINTNTSASFASANLASSSSQLTKVLNRLSSGSKIVNPSDDAGGLAVAMKVGAGVRRLTAINKNLGNVVSFLQTQDGVLTVAGKVLDRISELKTLSGDVTKNSSDLANYDSEFLSLKSQLTALGNEKFNGVALFGTSSLSVQTGDATNNAMSVAGISLFGSTGTPTTLNFATNSTTTSFTPSGPGTLSASGGHTLYFTNGGVWGNVIGTINSGGSVTYDGIGGWSTISGGTLSGSPIYVDDNNQGGTATFTPTTTTNTGSITAASSLTSLSLDTVKNAIADIATFRAQNGASQSRIDFASQLQTVTQTNLESAVSRIEDVDVATESTQLARWNTLVRAGTAMLSQANQSSQTALRLLSA